MRTRTGRTRAGAAAGAALLLAACGPGGGENAVRPADRPRGSEVVFLLSIDTLRPDHLGAYGDPVARTPHLDRLARTGVQAETALAAAPVTLPSHATLLSGRVPPEHGARDNGLFRVNEDVPLLAEVFQDAGWETVAFLAAYPLQARFGLARGFDSYRDSFGPRTGNSSFAERKADAVVDESVEWMDGRGRGPAFVWGHLFDPHAPYEAPVPWRRLEGGAYRQEIAFTDHEAGRWIRALRDRFERVRICVTADHGESLGEHGEETHGIFIYDATTRVPLLFHGDVSARIDPRPVSLASVAATLAAWAGLREDGRGFAPPLPLDRPWDPQPASYQETLYPQLRHGWAPLRSFRTERWKVIRAPEPEVYDLVADPRERHNLYESRRSEQTVAALFERLEDERWAPVEPSAAPDPEVEEALQSLGYAGSKPRDDTRDESDLPDPKTRIRIETLLSRAGGALENGTLPRARSALSTALSIDPRNKETYLLLARLEAAAGQHARSEELFEYCLGLAPASLDSQVLYERGTVRMDMGHLRGAEEDLFRCVELDPLNVDARFNWGLVAYRAGEYQVAADRWRSALRLDPHHPNAKRWLPDAVEKARGGGS